MLYDKFTADRRSKWSLVSIRRSLLPGRDVATGWTCPYPTFARGFSWDWCKSDEFLRRTWRGGECRSVLEFAKCWECGKFSVSIGHPKAKEFSAFRGSTDPWRYVPGRRWRAAALRFLL